MATAINVGAELDPDREPSAVRRAGEGAVAGSAVGLHRIETEEIVTATFFNEFVRDALVKRVSFRTRWITRLGSRMRFISSIGCRWPSQAAGGVFALTQS